MVDMHERRKRLKFETFHKRPIRVSEGQELIGHRAEELAGFIVGAGYKPGSAHIGCV